MKDINELQEQLSQLRKDYKVLYETKTLSLMIGEMVLKSRHSLKELFLLPFRLYKLKKDFKRKKIQPVSIGAVRHLRGDVKTHAVLFMATNGVGLGHLTRCLSVARKMKKTLGTKQIVFLTTCPALHLIWNEGFIPFYVPSKEMFKNDITGGQWDILLSSAFDNMFCLYDFDLIIFDGAIPYNSLVNALKQSEHAGKIWIRRGSAKKDMEENRQKSEEFFDYIILPSEAGDKLEEDMDKFIHVNPIVYLDRDEQLPKAEVRKFFGAKDNQKLIYVQLGAGKINNTENVLDTVINLLLDDPNNLIVLGQSPLGNNLSYIDDRIILIKDYPNAKFFRGFDMAISATGYNSFHELLSSNVPTVYLPNTNTGTDDQTARALRSEQYGLGIVVTTPNRDNIKNAIAQLMEQPVLEKQIVFCGAQQASDKLLEIYNQKRNTNA